MSKYAGFSVEWPSNGKTISRPMPDNFFGTTGDELTDLIGNDMPDGTDLSIVAPNGDKLTYSAPQMVDDYQAEIASTQKWLKDEGAHFVGHAARKRVRKSAVAA